MKPLAYWFRGHDWAERKPHHMWSINTFDCTRCGLTREAGFDGRGLPIRGSVTGMSARVSVKREVEVESGQEHVWWTVTDRTSGYNKTFRDEAEANTHAETIKQGNAAVRKALHEAQKQYLKGRKSE